MAEPVPVQRCPEADKLGVFVHSVPARCCSNAMGEILIAILSGGFALGGFALNEHFGSKRRRLVQVEQTREKLQATFAVYLAAVDTVAA